MIYKKIIEYCQRQNLTIAAFEKMCGLSNGTVGKWKDKGNPSLETLQKIVSATGISAEEWMNESDA